MLSGDQLPVGIGTDQAIRGVAQPVVGQDRDLTVRGPDRHQGDDVGTGPRGHQLDDLSVKLLEVATGERKERGLGDDRVRGGVRRAPGSGPQRWWGIDRVARVPTR
jgi:hypothetical protein